MARETARKRAKLYRGKVSPALNAAQLEALRERILRFSDTVTETAAVHRDAVVAEARTAAPAEIS